MNVFELRERLVTDYADYTRSFLHVADDRIRQVVEEELKDGLLWPEALVQVNPSYEPGGWIDELVDRGLLHPRCSAIFRRNKDAAGGGEGLRLYRHQVEAIEAARRGENYVLTTGTGSGKSLAYIIPIVDSVLREPGPGIKAIVVYPMNALANSQEKELAKFLQRGFPDGRGPVTFRKYTGQEPEELREEIMADPPDILLTNYMMLELVLVRPRERRLVEAAMDLRFLVLDELHTYRGRQGADVALLMRRVREATRSPRIQYVGTSATLAGSGTLTEQRQEIADVATTLFGQRVAPSAVIGETLRRVAHPPRIDDPHWLERLRARIAGRVPPPATSEAFRADPLAGWVEATIGLREDPETGRLLRATPRPITGKAGIGAELARLTGEPIERCTSAIRSVLELGQRLTDPETGNPLFAFRVHQFFSRGDAVYASLQPAAERYITTQAQQIDPTDPERRRLLFPLAFCRECGQDYYVVARDLDPGAPFEPRLLSDVLKEENRAKGFLVLNTDGSWPRDGAELLDRLPDEWIEETPTGRRVKPSFRDQLPKHQRVGANGDHDDPAGVDVVYLPAPLRFCLNCGVAYAPSQATDLGKLNSLGSGGRSSATTLLSLRAVQELRSAPESGLAARLLAFTDNRQDASLQAGHFNDFVMVGVLRAALHAAALEAAPEGGLRHETLAEQVTRALGLRLEDYAQDPSVRFVALQETERALRDVIGYRIYRDQQSGWRVTSPNLEQVGLLEIRYESLDELARADEYWESRRPLLAEASPEQRAAVARALLDHLRRNLAIQVDYLDPNKQDQLRLRSNQYLAAPWALDEDERLERAAVAYPRPQGQNDYQGDLYISGRGGMGAFVARQLTKPGQQPSVTERQAVIRDLFEVLRVAGLVACVRPPRDPNDVAGYQLKAAGIRWVGHPPDAPRPFTDPIRIRRPPREGHRANRFFLDFYSRTAATYAGLEAREHTAQVPTAERISREEDFNAGRLPVLYCSPTMELGVDIADLNVVGMRNVPPTPANYAQRSGRAGRSGAPALIFNYCAWGSSHDQYFFRRPELMVSGQVRPPRLELANEDLVRSHVHAIWLAETGLDLKTSLAAILDLDGDPPRLELEPSVRAAISNPIARQRALAKAQSFLASLPDSVRKADWYTDRWLAQTIEAAPLAFDRACERWRDLYRSAWQNRAFQHAIVGDHSRSRAERDRAQQLRDQAEAQLKLLTGDTDEATMQADFYSYRYFASEGFLPGYAFPRLPLSAWIPGRRGAAGRKEYLSRPRFLAISEFGPRSIVYHEGSRYRIVQVMLPHERAADNRLVTGSAKHCSECGHLHELRAGDPGPDLCQQCGAELPPAIDRLFRLRNVVTRRVDRITSDEEERQRIGFEIRTAIRFATHEGRPAAHRATVQLDGQALAELTFAPAATIWRMNVGWRRRANKERLGFVLDTERGYWARNDADPDDPEQAMSQSRELVIPYVEDTRNVLLFDPKTPLSRPQMASLGAALKVAIQAEYQLEDSELAVEPLPSDDQRRRLLFYEAAEGGAGVLRRLVDEPAAIATVARAALELCHFDPVTGEDRRKAPGARDDCAAACYDCLMSYTNQQDHPLLDRFAVRDWLHDLSQAHVEASPEYRTRHEHLERLRRVAESSLERRWLEELERAGYALPEDAQPFIEAARARPDFLYPDKFVAIFVDGPVHDYPDVEARDAAAQARLEELGYYVLRFGPNPAEWPAIFAANPSIFGGGR